MMGAFSIRPASLADYEQLCALWEVGDALHRQAVPHMFRASGEPSKSRAQVAALLEGPESAILVAQSGPEVIGLVTLLEKNVAANVLGTGRRYVELDNMAVTPAAQRRGVGRALVQAAETWAKARGIASLELNVYEFNDAAAGLYRAAGFAPVFRRMRREIPD